MLPLLAVPLIAGASYKAYKYGSKLYKAYERTKNVAKFSKQANNANKFSKQKLGVGVANSSINPISGLVAGGAGALTMAVTSSINDSIVSTMESNSEALQKTVDDLQKPITYQNSNKKTLLSVMEDSSVNHSKDLERLGDTMSLSNYMISQNLDVLNATNLSMVNILTEFTNSLPVVLGAVLTEIYNQSSQVVSDNSSASGDTVVNVNATAPVVNFDTSSLTTAISGLATSIHPQNRSDFYDKHNDIADYKLTPTAHADMFGNDEVNMSPLDIQTKKNLGDSIATALENSTTSDDLDLDDIDEDFSNGLLDLSKFFTNNGIVDNLREIADNATDDFSGNYTASLHNPVVQLKDNSSNG